MEIRQLRSFQAVAETGSFTKASQRVHLTQAAVSMQIRLLEEELGVPVFSRVNKKVLLTQAGEILLRHANRILKEHDDAKIEVADLSGEQRGRLRIGTASTRVSSYPLPEILHQLKLKHPLVELSVIGSTSYSIVKNILKNNLDIGLVSLPVEANDVVTEVLRRDELVAIVAPDHPLSSAKSVNAAALAREPLILGERGGNTRRMIDLFFEKSNLKPKIIMELNRVASIRKMVENNLGVSIVPISAVSEDIASGRLRALKIKGFKFYWELGIVRLKSDYVPAVMKTFIKLCHEYFNV